MSRLEEIKDFLKNTILPEKRQQAIIDEVLEKYNPEEFTDLDMLELKHDILLAETERKMIINRMAVLKEFKENHKKRER